jgi:lysosomal acid lipase/cholesteryl ester hydrolase
MRMFEPRLTALFGADPDFSKSFIQIVNENGYSFETHEVKTEDGYKLNLFRIPGKKGAPVVFLQHGITDSADCWIMNKEKSPAFSLASAGYDVWLGNNRGTKYSMGHYWLDPKKDKEYWEFSYTELG